MTSQLMLNQMLGQIGIQQQMQQAPSKDDIINEIKSDFAEEREKLLKKAEGKLNRADDVYGKGESKTLTDAQKKEIDNQALKNVLEDYKNSEDPNKKAVAALAITQKGGYNVQALTYNSENGNVQVTPAINSLSGWDKLSPVAYTPPKPEKNWDVGVSTYNNFAPLISTISPENAQLFGGGQKMEVRFSGYINNLATTVAYRTLPNTSGYEASNQSPNDLSLQAGFRNEHITATLGPSINLNGAVSAINNGGDYKSKFTGDFNLETNKRKDLGLAATFQYRPDGDDSKFNFMAYGDLKPESLMLGARGEYGFGKGKLGNVYMGARYFEYDKPTVSPEQINNGWQIEVGTKININTKNINTVPKIIKKIGNLFTSIDNDEIQSLEGFKDVIGGDDVSPARLTGEGAVSSSAVALSEGKAQEISSPDRGSNGVG